MLRIARSRPIPKLCFPDYITVLGQRSCYEEIFAFNKMLLCFTYDEESDHSNKAVRKTPEIESGHKVSEEVK